MPHKPPFTSPDARHADNRLLESLQRRREGVAAPEPLVPGVRAVDANTELIAQAKGALMFKYRIDSWAALAVLVHWARVTRTPVRIVAHTLMHAICAGNPQTEVQQGPLIRWLEAQLQDDDPHLADLPTTPVWSRART